MKNGFDMHSRVFLHVEHTPGPCQYITAINQFSQFAIFNTEYMSLVLGVFPWQINTPARQILSTMPSREVRLE